MSTHETIQLERDGAVATVTLNRPDKLNALNVVLLGELSEALTELERDASVLFLILTGAGDKAFAAGADIGAMTEMSPTLARAFAEKGHAVGAQIEGARFPVLGAVNGFALGGGCELALACDFRISRASAALGFLQGKLNITTAWGGGADLLRILGPGRGLELLLSSRVMTAPEALQRGLVDQVVPDGEDLLAAVRAHAAQYLSKPSHVIRAFTRLAHATRSFQQAYMAPLELQSFVDTWVDDAHWAAATTALTGSKAADGKA